MTEENKGHDTTISMVKTAPAELNGGTDFVLKVRVSCASACDLWGKLVKIITHDDVMAKQIVLNSFDGTASEAAEFTVTAPLEPGEYTWTAMFPAQEKAGVLHGESLVTFSFNVKPHTINLEVYDVPSPITVGEEFKIKVGVKCSAGCKLAGQEIVITNRQGEKVASGKLDDVPSPEAASLYTANISVKAPGIERRYRWTANLIPLNLEHSHDEVSSNFVFMTARKSEYVVTIEATDKQTKSLVKNAKVILRPLKYRGTTYRCSTDENGIATINVPGGKFQLFVSAEDQQYFKPTLEVNDDVSIKTELTILNWD